MIDYSAQNLGELQRAIHGWQVLLGPFLEGTEV